MDLFDDVLLLEGNASAKGAAEGEVHGHAEGRFEGWQAGAAAGTATGVELGFYHSCATSWHRETVAKLGGLGSSAGAAVSAGLVRERTFASATVRSGSAGAAGSNNRLCRELLKIQKDIEGLLKIDPATDLFSDRLEKVHALFRKLAVNMGFPELAPSRDQSSRDTLDF